LNLCWQSHLDARSDWRFDVVRLKNGTTFQGLLIEETPTEVRFRCVRRHAGSPTVVITTAFTRNEIAGIDKLNAADREVLETRLKALDPTGKNEAERMENLELESARWIKPGAGDALRYSSTYFTLVSNAREDIVRRAAVRLEQIYAAFARFLPQRGGGGKPTTIYLLRSLAEYHGLLQEQRRDILNPAFYDAAKNQILCASDLQRLGDDLEQIRKKHQEILDKLKENEAELTAHYKGKLPATIRNRFSAKRQEIHQANLKNDAIFKEATGHLFQTLYHEAFHAYLANFVYPPNETKVPRWLNEGLAQIFETAIVEAGELRVGHADADRLARIKEKLRKGQLVPLTELLRAGPEKFLVNHATDQQISDRYYLNAWALAFYLTFDRHRLGTKALDRYAYGLKLGTDPLEAFRDLAGIPLSRFEDEFHQYLRELRKDGTTANMLPGNKESSR
jgi:hypothetical protein